MGQADLQTLPEEELEQLRRRNAELEILYEAIRDLTSTLSVREVLERLLARTLDHLEAEIGSILLLANDCELRIVTAQGLPEQVVNQTRMELGDGISGHVAATGSSLLVRDIESDPRFRRRNHERYYTRSLISCPFVLKKTVLGLINVNNKRSHEPFGFDDLRLLEAIAGHAAVALGNARRYEETLRRAQRDGLTGLANHAHFVSTLEIEIERALRYGRELALVMIDVDHFKAYNDRFGHPAGDEALVRVADTIAKGSRTHDVVARYGGEEFAIILPETSLEGAVAFSEKIRWALEEVRLGPDAAARLTVSVGVARLSEECKKAAELIAAADVQLYRAKSLGRNRVCPPGLGAAY
jgi:diguanylate cyclase (GGDEF)-like protein